MSRPTIVLSGKDIQGLTEIAVAVLECEALSDQEEVAKRYALIGRTLQENVKRLGLNEEINQLLEFARNVGCELQSPDTRACENPSGCWAPQPRRHFTDTYFLQVNGSNDPSSCVKSPEKQQIGMTMVVLHHLERDSSLSLGAKKLLRYHEAQHSWTEQDARDLWA